MDETAERPKFSRFAKHIVLASIFGCALSMAPGLSYLNCLFCLPSAAGIVLALWMYLKANPGDMVSAREAAGFGAMAGAWAGLAVGVLIALIFGVTAAAPLIAHYASGKDGLLDGVGSVIAVGALFALLSTAATSGFGALGAVLGMRLFFEARIRKP
jgi:hypothetical protein